MPSGKRLCHACGCKMVVSSPKKYLYGCQKGSTWQHFDAFPTWLSICPSNTAAYCTRRIFLCFSDAFRMLFQLLPEPRGWSGITGRTVGRMATPTTKCEGSMVRSLGKQDEMMSSAAAAVLPLGYYRLSYLSCFAVRNKTHMLHQIYKWTKWTYVPECFRAYWLNLSAWQHDRALCGGMCCLSQ